MDSVKQGRETEDFNRSSVSFPQMERMRFGMESVLLDIDNIARIGLLFLDGDTLEEIYLDEYGAADYDFAKFTETRRSLLMIEKIHPDLNVTAAAWRLHPDNDDLAVPAVIGSTYPVEGFQRCRVHRELKLAFDSGAPQKLKRENGWSTHYYPIRNSDADLVGILELTLR